VLEPGSAWVRDWFVKVPAAAVSAREVCQALLQRLGSGAARFYRGSVESCRGWRDQVVIVLPRMPLFKASISYVISCLLVDFSVAAILDRQRRAWRTLDYSVCSFASGLRALWAYRIYAGTTQ